MRSWRRGTREMDLVLGEFADAEIDRLNDQELAAYEALLDVADAELFQWITGEKPVPEVHDTPLLRRLVASRRLPEP